MSFSNDEIKYYLWCLPAFKYYLYTNGKKLHKCYFKNCNRAHSASQIKLYQPNKVLLEMDLENLNIVELKDAMLESLNINYKEINKNNIIKPKIILTPQKINHLEFFDMLNYWITSAKYFRKLKKDNRHLKNITTMKINLLNEKENILWALNRLIHMCDIHGKCINKIIKKNKDLQKDEFCIGGPNCKNGCHRRTELLCIEDFITGKCKCLPSEQYKKSKHENYIKLKKLLDRQSRLPTHRCKGIDIEINTQRKIYQRILRKVHFSDRNFICYNQQIKNHKIKQKSKINLWDHRDTLQKPTEKCKINSRDHKDTLSKPTEKCKINSWDHRNTLPNPTEKTGETKKYKLVRTKRGFKKVLI